MTVNDIRKWTSKDMVFARVHHFHNTWLARYMSRGCVETSDFNRWNELSAVDGCILWGARVVIPLAGHSSVLRQLHESHLGI